MALILNYIEFNQPIGTYYMAKVSASELLDHYDIRRREYTFDKGIGIQRQLNSKRAKDISFFTSTKEATFPTAIICSVSEDGYVFEGDKLKITGKLDIIDGQHRIEGIKHSIEKDECSQAASMELPLVIVLDPTEEQKAYIFATINGNQAKVDKSIVYDLFGISDNDLDPFAFCHKVARAMNFSDDSPFSGKLKMLGRKSSKDSGEILSQGTFIKFLLLNISSSPQQDRDLAMRKRPLPDDASRCLRRIYLKGNIKGMVSILNTYFSEFMKNFNDQWEDSVSYILSKSTGYSGLMSALSDVIKYHEANKSNTYSANCSKIVKQLKMDFEADRKDFSTKHFSLGAPGIKQVADSIREAISKL